MTYVFSLKAIFLNAAGVFSGPLVPSTLAEAHVLGPVQGFDELKHHSRHADVIRYVRRANWV